MRGLGSMGTYRKDPKFNFSESQSLSAFQHARGAGQIAREWFSWEKAMSCLIIEASQWDHQVKWGSSIVPCARLCRGIWNGALLTFFPSVFGWTQKLRGTFNLLALRSIL